MSGDFVCRLLGHRWKYTYNDEWPYRCERCWWTPEWRVQLIAPPRRFDGSRVR